MNVTLARTFLEILKAGSLNKAAEQLHVTQSTVTTRLNVLEDQLRQRLIIRNKSGVELTNAGFKFQRYAESFVQTWHQAQQILTLPETCTSSLTVGFEYDLWDGAIDEWVGWFQKTRNDVAVEVWSADADTLSRWLTSSRVDVAITFGSSLRSAHRAAMIFEDRLILVSRVKKAHKAPDPDYIFVDWGEAFRRAHTQVYPVNKRARLTFGNGSLALKHLLDHVGSAYFPLRAIHDHLQDGDLHVISGGAELSVPVFLSRSPLAQFEDWFDDAVETLAAIAARHNDISLATVPLEDWEGLDLPL